MVINAPDIDILSLIRCPYTKLKGRDEKVFFIPNEWPDIYIVNDFIRGLLSTRGKKEGQYPDPYLEMIESIFGVEKETLEVCSRHIKADGVHTSWTVDLDPQFRPTFLTNAETLKGIPNNFCKRIRMDPPYNEETAKTMYNGKKPNFYKMLAAASRVLKVGGLIFMLLGPDNYQINVDRLGLRRIGLIAISVVPNYEMRKCEIYRKERDTDPIPDNELYEIRAANIFYKYEDKMQTLGQSTLELPAS